MPEFPHAAPERRFLFSLRGLRQQGNFRMDDTAEKREIERLLMQRAEQVGTRRQRRLRSRETRQLRFEGDAPAGVHFIEQIVERFCVEIFSHER